MVNAGGVPTDPQAQLVFRQLCHMLSLSRTGKVQSAIDSLVLTTLAIDPKVGSSGDPNEVAIAVSTYFGVSLDVGDVRLAIEKHLRAGRLLIDRSSDPHRVVLSADTRAQVSERVSDSSALEEAVKQEWLSLSEGKLPGADGDTLWAALQIYLGSVFRQHGAEAVQLLDPSASHGETGINLSTLMNDAIKQVGLSSQRDRVRDCIAGFFIDPSPARLRYMAELLDGTFTFFALTVSDATVDYLRGQVPSLRLFLDTNVVLGLLGLQDNPLQEACVELLEFIREHKYPFQLYYHERTLQELLDIVEAASHNLKRQRFSSALSRAYLQYASSHGGAFGLELRFHTLNADREIDVEAFLARFSHIEELLKDQGAKRYNQSAPEFDVETKGRHIAEFEHFLKETRPARPRRYKALDHDVVVWMSLQRQRRAATSALKSGALLLSNDYSLQSFDRQYLMRQADGKQSPTVVLPQHLLQVLRPLAASTPDFDKRFMEVFAAPEFRTAQSDYDATVSRVLSYLASFDGVPTETAVTILNDDLLMGRLKDAEADSAEFGELIESAVLQENSLLLDRIAESEQALATASTERERLAAEAARLEAERAAAAEQLEALESGARRQEEDRRRAVDTAREERSQREGIERQLEEERQQREKAEARVAVADRRAARTRQITGLLVGLVGVGLLVGGPVLWDWSPWSDQERFRASQALLTVMVLGIAYMIVWKAHRGAVLTGVVFAAAIGLLALL
jgi:hypothetical protein